MAGAGSGRPALDGPEARAATEKRFFREGLLRETAAGPVLLASRCTGCHRAYFPKVEFCPRCYEAGLEELELSRTGTLYAYTVTRVPLVRFDPPHPLGVIRLPEDEVSLLAPLILGADETLQPGTEMELVVAPLWLDDDGAEVYGYKFRSCGGRDR